MSPGSSASQLSLIGAGSVATALARGLQRSGWTVAEVAARTEVSARKLAGALDPPARVLESYAALDPRSAVVLLAVADEALAGCAEGLAAAGAGRAGRLFCHTSGFHCASILEPLQHQGALVAATHPLLSFADPQAALERLAGATFTIEGEPEGLAAARVWIESLGGRCHAIDARGKVLYHAAAVFACNYLVTLMDAAERCLQAAAGTGAALPREILFPLVEGTVANLRAAGRASDALGGPLARGELDVVRGHLEALSGDERSGSLYRYLARDTLALVAERGELDPEHLRALAELLSGEGP